jgi:hypothetical protein
MPWVWFEPTIPASERAKTVHVLDRSVTVTGSDEIFTNKNSLIQDSSIHSEPILVYK